MKEFVIFVIKIHFYWSHQIIHYNVDYVKRTLLTVMVEIRSLQRLGILEVLSRMKQLSALVGPHVKEVALITFLENVPKDILACSVVDASPDGTKEIGNIAIHAQTCSFRLPKLSSELE